MAQTLELLWTNRDANLTQYNYHIIVRHTDWATAQAYTQTGACFANLRADGGITGG